MKQVVAVIVTYNRKELLKECIDAILRLRGQVPDILVVDNASTDGTWEFLGIYNHIPQVKCYHMERNMGGAGGFHQGMKLALEYGYDYVWLMDDDTIVESDALEKLLEADEKLDGNYGFLSGVAYWTDGNLCNMNLQRVGIKKMLTDYTKEYSEVIMASFVSFFVKAQTIREVGLPIEEFFIWADDLEYSRRISRKMPCFVVTGSRVIHKMSSNDRVGIESDSLDRLWRYEYLYRNEVYVFRREGIRGIIYLMLRVILHLSRVLIKGGPNRFRKMAVILKSLWKGIAFKPEIKYVTERK